jgi:hyaluronoglucosaminidase
MSSGPVGLIEGFYGPPWSWPARHEVAAWAAERGMRDFVYAPKDDPKHRERWRDPYDDEELAAFGAFADEGALRLGFAISPGLSIDAGSHEDRAVLGAKVDQVVEAGATTVVLALDDIPFGGGPQGEAHAGLARWLHEHLAGRAALALVPTEYVGVRPSPYLDALASGVPPEVPIAWTGRAVVNDAIGVADAEQRAAALGGRPPLLWDNVPVNDGPMGDRLFLGPLQGREAGLVDACAGYLANPMVQPLASRLPLASIAAWLQGEDPQEAWATAAADLGWATFARCCDTREPHLAVAAALQGDPRPARALFEAAAACAAPGIEGEVEPWVRQVRRDGRLALAALDVLAGERGVTEVLGLALRWQASRRAEVTVFGPRCSVRPALGQADDGTWTVLAGAVQHDDNAVDTLVSAALATLTDGAPPS